MENIIKITVLVLIIMQLILNNSLAQTRENVAAQLASIVNDQDQRVSNIKNLMSSDCSSFSLTVGALKKTKDAPLAGVGTMIDSYTNIPWKDVERISWQIDGEMACIFFSKPILQNRTEIPVAKNGKVGDSVTTVRTVKSILMLMKKNNFYLFENLCLKLKFGSSYKESKNEMRLASFPAVDYYKEKPAPKRQSVKWALIDLVEGMPCDNNNKRERVLCDIAEQAGLDISNIQRFSDSQEASIMRDYWNIYCYSFSDKGSYAVYASHVTLMELAIRAYSKGYGSAIRAILKGNVNYLNPYSGKNYLDVLFMEYSNAEHRNYDQTYHLEVIQNYIESANKSGIVSANEMIERYKHDLTTYKQLIESIICNSTGEGLFARLENDPGQYLLFIYNVGIRNFDDANLLFENVYKKKLSLDERSKFRKEIKGTKLFWN